MYDTVENLLKDQEVRQALSWWRRRCSNIMDPHELESAMYWAIYRASCSHDDSRQKFSSTLQRYLKWEIDRVRRANLNYKNRSVPIEYVQNIDSIPVNQNDLSIQHDAKVVLEWSKWLLSREDRKLLQDYYWNNLTISEIAKNNGCAQSAVSDRINKCLTILRQYGERNDETEVCDDVVVDDHYDDCNSSGASESSNCSRKRS